MEKLYFVSTQTAHLFQTIAKIKINYKNLQTGNCFSLSYSRKNGPITHYKSDLKTVAGVTILEFFSQCIKLFGDIFLISAMISDHR